MSRSQTPQPVSQASEEEATPAHGPERSVAAKGQSWDMILASSRTEGQSGWRKRYESWMKS
eukprot:12901004-Heterocapsa_arctica.AAC.1